MRLAALEYLRCPLTGSELELEGFASESDAASSEPGGTIVVEGVLRSKDGEHEYPIIGGIPRFILPGERRGLGARYPEYFAVYSERLGEALVGECLHRDVQDRTQAQIIERFGYEWTEFGDYASDNFLYWIDPVQPDFFPGRTGLDVGCGAGRHAAQAVSYGAEMFAMDLSWAVDTAEARARTVSNLHVIQANAFAPPFAPETFDFLFSLGVLHHTPDPPRAFESVAPLVRRGGSTFLMIYGSQRKWVIRALRLLRAITTRLPNVAIKFLSYVGGIVDFAFVLPFRGLSRIGLGKLARAVFPTRVYNYSQHSFMTGVTDWFDRLSYPEVHYYSDSEIQEWYASSDYERVSVRPLLNHAYCSLGYRA